VLVRGRREDLRGGGVDRCDDRKPNPIQAHATRPYYAVAPHFCATHEYLEPHLRLASGITYVAYLLPMLMLRYTLAVGHEFSDRIPRLSGTRAVRTEHPATRRRSRRTTSEAANMATHQWARTSRLLFPTVSPPAYLRPARQTVGICSTTCPAPYAAVMWPMRVQISVEVLRRVFPFFFGLLTWETFPEGLTTLSRAEHHVDVCFSR